MVDPELVKFYNNVKDPSWPEIKNYADFINLPANIKKECYEDFNLETRKQEISDKNYWNQLMPGNVFKYKNLVYVPVSKCASINYTEIFNKLGWEYTNYNNIDLDNSIMFGFIMHPLQRYLKGITELLVLSYQPLDIFNLENDDVNPYKKKIGITDYNQLLKDLDTCYFKNLIPSIIVGDDHSAPYTAILSDKLYKTNWIPLDILTPKEQLIALQNLFNKSGHHIDLPLHQIQHKSNSQKLEVFEKVSDMALNNKHLIYYLYRLFDQDLKFYYNLIDNFDATWQQII